jgi:hypothetical protein
MIGLKAARFLARTVVAHQKMTSVEILIAVTIHLVIPIAGLLIFLRIARKMKVENVSNPPTIDLFLTFATYGGLLLMALTTLFWQWSGMASLGAFYLIFGAPIAMGVIAYRNYNKRELSIYHLWTYRFGLSYYLILPLTSLTLLAVG